MLASLLIAIAIIWIAVVLLSGLPWPLVFICLILLLVFFT